MSLNISLADDQKNVKSVKELARKLNRLNTESEIKFLKSESTSNLRYNKKENTKPHKHVEVECFDFSDVNYLKIDRVPLQIRAPKNSFKFSGPKPHEKEWILICSRGDYMEIAKMLFKQPNLVQKKDPFNTVAHWACKYGNLDLLKLVASTLESESKTNPQSLKINDLINSRTGYTCLHIAYIYNHSELVPYLKTYGAEALTDYSGKNGIDYSRGSSSNNDQHHQHHFLDLNESKSQSPDILNDTSSSVKRNNSSVTAREKEIKDLILGFRVNENRSFRPKLANLAESPFRRNQQVLAHSSPVNLIETTSSSNILMPPPKTTVIFKPKFKNKTPEDNQNLHESKENVFI